MAIQPRYQSPCRLPYAARASICPWHIYQRRDCGLHARYHRPREKELERAEGGAGGMILYNPTINSLNTDNHFFRPMHIYYTDGRAANFPAAHPGAHTDGRRGEGFEQGNVIAAFSSRGGPGQLLGVSKPDIAAPGVNILAGNTPASVDIAGGPPGELFHAIGGTSMAGPHIAGSGALMKAQYPNWRPGKSNPH